jgi:hypothetical protein
MNIPQYALVTYYRNKKGEPIGIIVSKKRGNNGDFTIGYSQCRKSDKFSRKMGLKIAFGRCETGSFGGVDAMPRNLRKMLPNFVKRCERYYKQEASV